MKLCNEWVVGYIYYFPFCFNRLYNDTSLNMVEGLVMEFVTSALLGGVLYDLVSSPIKLSAAYIKAALDNIVNLEDKVAVALADELSKQEYKNAASKDALAVLIDSSRTLQEIVTQLNDKPQTVININAYGDGDAFNGDKVMGDKLSGDKVMGDKLDLDDK
jgi:hypothetical protein